LPALSEPWMIGPTQAFFFTALNPSVLVELDSTSLFNQSVEQWLESEPNWRQDVSVDATLAGETHVISSVLAMQAFHRWYAVNRFIRHIN